MDYIEIQGYKSIKTLKLDLLPINILIGANGSGKSNFISFFEFLNKLYERNLQEYIALKGGQEKILFQGSKITDRISSHISFNNRVNGYSFTITAGEGNMVFTSEDLWYHNNSWAMANYSNEAKVKTNGEERAQYINQYLDSYRKYHFHDTGKNSAFTHTSHIDNDSFYLYEEGRNLAAFLFSIFNENKIVYNRIIKTIQSIAPFFSDFFFKPTNDGLLRLQWKSKYSSTIYGVNDLSDGTIRFIALCVLFLQPDLPSSIIIDEPELGLHPYAIAKLAGMIKSVAGRNTQVILATQSADLVNHFNPEDIITVDQVEGGSQFNRLSNETFESWLVEYSLGDLWQKNIISRGQPNAV
ncbi:MAG: AAA family ATPase [Polaribacter sp.]